MGSLAMIILQNLIRDLIALAGPGNTISATCDIGRDPFNQNSNRSDREKRTTSKGGPVFPKLFRLDRTDPLRFGPKFPESLVEWIAPIILIYWPHTKYSLNTSCLDSGLEVFWFLFVLRFFY